jgi:hypothetical protein
MGPRKFSTRRKMLLSILVCALLANFAALFFIQRTEKFDFVLEPLNTNGTLGGGSYPGPLPVFDGSNWSIDGEPVSTLTVHLLDTDKWERFHTVGKVMLIEIPDNAGSDSFHRAIASLAEQGICQVAVFDRSAPKIEQGLATAVLVRQYRDAKGESRVCIDRVNGGTVAVPHPRGFPPPENVLDILAREGPMQARGQ